jgi:hypothetical protein
MTVDIPVNLIAGHDYVFDYCSAPCGSGSDAPIITTLTDPTGRVIISRQAWTDGEVTGEEFRAQYSATYFIHVTDGEAWIDPDCAGNLTTYCHLSINHTHKGLFSNDIDRDWLAVKLIAGRKYTIIYTGAPALDLTMRDKAGKALAHWSEPYPPSVTYRPSKSGLYYLDVFEGWTGSIYDPYTITLRIRQ